MLINPGKQLTARWQPVCPPDLGRPHRSYTARPSLSCSRFGTPHLRPPERECSRRREILGRFAVTFVIKRLTYSVTIQPFKCPRSAPRGRIESAGEPEFLLTITIPIRPAGVREMGRTGHSDGRQNVGGCASRLIRSTRPVALKRSRHPKTNEVGTMGRWLSPADRRTDRSAVIAPRSSSYNHDFIL